MESADRGSRIRLAVGSWLRTLPALPRGRYFGAKLMGMSDHEYYGAAIPTVFRYVEAGDHAAATELYWQIHPARKAKQAAAAQLHGGAFIDRQAWRFQAWLQGYNDGPLRQPTQRIHEAQMNLFRKGLVDSGLEPTGAPKRDFFVGRNPT